LFSQLAAYRVGKDIDNLGNFWNYTGSNLDRIIEKIEMVLKQIICDLNTRIQALAGARGCPTEMNPLFSAEHASDQMGTHKIKVESFPVKIEALERVKSQLKRFSRRSNPKARLS
jgi:hypothetical protein